MKPIEVFWVIIIILMGVGGILVATKDDPHELSREDQRELMKQCTIDAITVANSLSGIAMVDVNEVALVFYNQRINDK